MGMAPGVSSSSAGSPDGVNKASHSLSELVTAYASLLAANGQMVTALDYLEHVPGEASGGRGPQRVHVGALGLGGECGPEQRDG